MNINDVFPSKYLKAGDLNGSEVSVRITGATIEKLGDEQKLLLTFAGAKKGLICNKTNADRIAHLYGLDTDGWIGCEIVLYSEMTNFGGKVTEGVRVKAPLKKAAQATPHPVSRPVPPPAKPRHSDEAMPVAQFDDEVPF